MKDEQYLDPLLNYQSSNPSEQIPLLQIDDDIISLERAFEYLRLSEQLPRFLLEITKQYLIEQEIKRLGIEANNTEIVEQFILEFRLQQQLTTLDKFHEWLGQQGLNYKQFRSKIEFITRLEALKKQAIKPLVMPYFLAKQQQLERLILSRLVVDKREVAETLKEEIQQNSDKFADFAKQYSMVDDAIIGGLMGAVSRQDMPDLIAGVTTDVVVGDILGPIEIENRFCLLKVDQIIPAELDTSTREQIENQLFDDWLKERLEKANIQLLLSNQ